MHSFDEVFGRVAAVIASTFHLGEATVIAPETTSAQIEGWDSLSHAILVMHIEEAFQVELPLERAVAAANVGELARIVHEAT